MFVCLVRMFLYNEISSLYMLVKSMLFVAAIQRNAALVASMAYPQSIRKYAYSVSWRRERDSQEDTIEQKADTTKDTIEKKADTTKDAIEQ